MTVTYEQLTDRVKQLLMGFTKNQDQFTWLTAPMAATDTTFTVDPSTITSVSRGVNEIDNELMYVTSYNVTSGLVNIAAGTNGRGILGTTATTHSVNALVTADPDFPRSAIQTEINNTIQAMYPSLPIFTEYDFPKVAARYEYDLPATTDQVYRVTADTIGPSRVWFPSQTWRFNPQASTTSDGPNASVTGKTLQIMDFIVPGRAIHCVLVNPPNVLVNMTDEYSATTGFFERSSDCVVYGTAARILASYEPARLQQKAVESTERSPLVPAGSASNAANYFWNLYYRRLQEEQDYIRRLYPEYQTFSS